jgi:hypothetical protein
MLREGAHFCFVVGEVGGGGLKKRSKEKRTDIQRSSIIKIREREGGRGSKGAPTHVRGEVCFVFEWCESHCRRKYVLAEA